MKQLYITSVLRLLLVDKFKQTILFLFLPKHNQRRRRDANLSFHVPSYLANAIKMMLADVYTVQCVVIVPLSWLTYGFSSYPPTDGGL